MSLVHQILAPRCQVYMPCLCLTKKRYGGLAYAWVPKKRSQRLLEEIERFSWNRCVGEDESILKRAYIFFNIFQMGWKHQPVFFWRFFSSNLTWKKLLMCLMNSPQLSSSFVSLLATSAPRTWRLSLPQRVAPAISKPRDWKPSVWSSQLSLAFSDVPCWSP